MAGKYEPINGVSFGIEIQGTIVGSFSQCSGLGYEYDVITVKEVENGKDVVRQVAGRRKWQNLVFKRSMTGSMDIVNWIKQVEDGDVEGARCNGSIVLFDAHGEEAARWNFENGWPSKVNNGDLNANGNQVNMEEVTIVHEGLWRVA